MEIDCARPGNPVLCGLLRDREFDLPIDADFSGNNYGLGFNLAGGWKGFFATLPVSFTWIEMDTTDIEGGPVIAASPRVGRLFKLGDRGNLGLYVGLSYLDSDLTSTGSLPIPGTNVTIDYTVDQENKDKWAGIVGANWDISSRWALQAEYEGFRGSRESIIASLGWRF
jgi:opacity protein-like surface antigen